MLMSFFSWLFGGDSAKKVGEAVLDAAVLTGKALAEAEMNKAIDDLEVEVRAIENPERRTALLAGIASLRVAGAALIAAIGEDG